MTLATSAIHRSLGQLAVRVQTATERRRAAAAAEGLNEIDLQFQVDISGRAGGLTWTAFDLAFDETFIDAPSQREADLYEPHFTYGVVIETGPPVLVNAHVSTWRTDAQGNIVGANVRVGAWDPTELGSDPAAFKPFTGRVHLNFQGFAVPNDPSDEDN